MQEYKHPLILRGQQHNGTAATLTAIRLPRSWYAVVWANDSLYHSLSQPITDKNRSAFDHFDNDDYFLDHVRLVANFQCGLLFDFAAGGGPRGRQ